MHQVSTLTEVPLSTSIMDGILKNNQRYPLNTEHPKFQANLATGRDQYHVVLQYQVVLQGQEVL